VADHASFVPMLPAVRSWRPVRRRSGAVTLAALLAATSTTCRSRQPAPPAPPITAAPEALPGIEPALAPTLNDGDAYFALVEPHLQRVSIYDPPDKFLAEYAKTPEKPRNLLAAHWCVSEISNGGLLQLFSSSAGVLVPEALTALQALGLPENAAIVAEAMKSLGAAYPRDQKRRNRALDNIKRRAKTDNPYAVLDERFFTALKAHPGGFDAVAASYARTP
jgi:hypothetical protein